MSGGESRLLGRWGEALAAEELRRRGCRLVEAGWRCRFGEVDLIAEEGPFLCFVEVKLRKDGRTGGPGAGVRGPEEAGEAADHGPAQYSSVLLGTFF